MQNKMRASHAQPVGWVERSDTHRACAAKVMGFATLYPSYNFAGVETHLSMKTKGGSRGTAL